MSDAANVDEAGNSVISWSGTAGNLLAARDTLARQRDAAEEKARGVSGSRRLEPEERSYWVEVMLMGFAVENLLKAFWIARGNQMYAAGKLLKRRALLRTAQVGGAAELRRLEHHRRG